MRVRIDDLTVRFGDVVAVSRLDLEVRDGELLALVGPSGCGKTTTLGFIAGFARASGGRLWFDDRDVTDLTPQSRNIGYVFQDYAIYPHLTVHENLRFPLDVGRVARGDALRRVQEAAALVGVGDLLARRPHQLSGGQRQRVALARALVKRPGVLLLDEPLSNLDAHLRVQTRAEIRRLQQELGMTTILVTHDQSEALAIADRVAVMDAGVIVGLAGPGEIYSRPPSLAAARFIGSPQMNLWTAREAALAGLASRVATTDVLVNGTAVLGVRPEDVRVDDAGAGVSAQITLVETLGRDSQIHARLNRLSVRALLPTEQAAHLAQGSTVGLTVPDGGWHWFDLTSGARIDLPTRSDPLTTRP